uniref:ARAD1C07194p n=1 Tax=Blastobotrys adeninivorans TaxID=409370 RepID=A0A060SZF3_BLAAD
MAIPRFAQGPFDDEEAEEVMLTPRGTPDTKNYTTRFPLIPPAMEFHDVVHCILQTVVSAISIPYSGRQLNSSAIYTTIIRPLVKSLVDQMPPKRQLTGRNAFHRPNGLHPGVVSALLICRENLMSGAYNPDNEYYETGLETSQADACELIATRFLYHCTVNDSIDFLTYEPNSPTPSSSQSDIATETSPLLENANIYGNMCSLELAVVYEAKKFLSSPPVESVMNRIWDGRIVFWDGISATTTKGAHIYHFSRSGKRDIYGRLRVPRYRSFFIGVNYAILLVLFYGLLFVEKRRFDGFYKIDLTSIEVLLHIWFAGFFLDEIMQAREASTLGQYMLDYWSVFDIAIIVLYLIFMVLRVVGFYSGPDTATSVTPLAFDILSLEALLLIPRFFSFLSIFPYFGTLLPCLRDLTKEFVKFLTIIFIVYFAFFTTFSFLGRGTFTISQTFWLLVQVFFGAASVGLDKAPDISPIFGPPLMLVFVTLTNILLITVLVSILSQRFSVIMLNAREEYALFFASTVLESMTTADRLTYFYPPLNLLGVILRPLRLFMNHDQYRQLRISVLKLSHWPIAVAIYLFELLLSLVSPQFKTKGDIESTPRRTR